MNTYFIMRKPAHTYFSICIHTYSKRLRIWAYSPAASGTCRATCHMCIWNFLKRSHRSKFTQQIQYSLTGRVCRLTYLIRKPHEDKLSHVRPRLAELHFKWSHFFLLQLHEQLHRWSWSSFGKPFGKIASLWEHVFMGLEEEPGEATFFGSIPP